MRILETVVKRSAAVLMIWLVLGLASVPALLRLEEVTEYRAERLLPTGAESLRANQIVMNISGRAMLAGQHILMVSGVNASDPEMPSIDYEIEKRLEGYVLYYSSPYTIARKVYEDLNRTVYSQIITVYGYASGFYNLLKILSENRDTVIQQLKLLTGYAYALRRYYEIAYSNRHAYRLLATEIHRNLSQLLDMGVPYEVFLELSKQMLAPAIGNALNMVAAHADDRAVELVVEHLARTAWAGSLTEDYVYRLVVGAPLVVVAVSATGDPGVIDQVLFGAPLINAVVNEVRVVDVEGVIVDTLYQLARLMGTAAGMATPSPVLEVVLKPLIRQLVRLPPSATEVEMVKALSQALYEAVAGAGLVIAPEDIEEAMYGVLIAGSDPLDLVVKIAARYAQSPLRAEEFSEYLRLSLKKGDPAILHKAVSDHLMQMVFAETVGKMKGLMVSEDGASFLVIVIPVGTTATERATNAYRAAKDFQEVLAVYGYRSASVKIISGDVLELEVREHMSRDIENVNRVSAVASALIALAVIGGLVATALPFVGVVTSLVVSHGILYLLSTANLITITSWSRLLAVSTALGLGMNYSSYIVTRFREVYPEIRNPRKAAYEAVRYALPAIVASATTDIIGFAVMRLAWEFPLIASIGEAVPIAIAVVFAVSLTLTPSLLALFGGKRWFWWPHRLGAGGAGKAPRLRLSAARSAALIALSLAVLVVGVVGFLGFRGSHDYSVFMPEGSSSYQAYVELGRAFPVGKLMPVYVVCRLRDGYSAYDEQVVKGLELLKGRLLEVNGVAEVYSHASPGFRSRELYVSRDGKTFYLEVILRPSPLSREGIDITREVRRAAKEGNPGYCEEVLVGGFSASSLEIEEMLDSVFWSRVVPVALVLMTVSMSLSFQSALSGPIAMLSIVMGYLAGVAFATFVANAFGQPLLWFLPLITLPAVLGVGLDYNSYYMNRQRYELSSGRDSYEASSKAVESVSHVVLGLGLIVVATYASLATGSSWGVRELGIALSVAVFTTTVLASYALTPALLAVLGRRAWWPGCKRWAKRD